MAKENGITRSEIAEILTHAAFYAGWPKAWAAFRMAKDIWADAENTDEKQLHQNSMVFPIGAPNDGFRTVFQRAELSCASLHGAGQNLQCDL